MASSPAVAVVAVALDETSTPSPPPPRRRRKLSSPSSPRDRDSSSKSLSPPEDMATMVAHPPAVPPGVNKRYRPAPAKTFQCRGYGECRMVFSRSEHLARHIRKHTGERPFSCHCGKQFSRLDNLRQHAQTVHADKQEQNERMMRDLTSLHATMAAANKAGTRGGKRGSQAAAAAAAVSPISQQHLHLHSDNDGSSGATLVKQEDTILSIHQRPGTSTGYESGDTNGLFHHHHHHHSPWPVQSPGNGVERPSSRLGHSFRDGQSFLAPPSPSASTLVLQQQQHQQHQHQHQHQHQQHSTQSFLSYPATYNFGISDPTSSARDSGRPGSSHASNSRPPTAGGADGHARMLPPLSAVVSATIPAQQQQSFPLPYQSAQNVLPLPVPSGGATTGLGFRRPNTAGNRPGTAPPSYYPAANTHNISTGVTYVGGPGMASRPSELSSFHSYGRVGDLGGQYGDGSGDCTSPSAGDSPFSWHPPALTDLYPGQSNVALGSSPPINRKRQFTGADGPGDDSAAAQEYEYGSDSRPQSRRLSVMELCNDDGSQQFLLSNSRPTTSTGLSSPTSALALVDRISAAAAHSSASPTLLSGVTSSATLAAASATRGSAASEFGGAGGGGGRVFAESRREFSTTPTAAGATLLPNAYRGAPFTSPSLSDDSSECSSRSPLSPHFRSLARSVHNHHAHSGGPPSPATADAIPRAGSASSGSDGRQQQQHHDQVRISVSPHSPTTYGMRA